MKVKSVLRNESQEIKLAQKLLFLKLLEGIAKNTAERVLPGLEFFGITLNDGEYIKITVSNGAVTANIFSGDDNHAVLEYE